MSLAGSMFDTSLRHEPLQQQTVKQQQWLAHQQHHTQQQAHDTRTQQSSYVQQATPTSSSTYSQAASDYSCVRFVVTITYLLVTFSMAVTMSYIGLIYWYRCPIEPNIPMWMLVQGVVFLFMVAYGVPMALISLLKCLQESTRNTLQLVVHLCNTIVGLFSFVWLMYIAILLYTMKEPSFTPERASQTYCQPTMYYFAWWYALIVAVLCVLSPCWLCCIAPIAYFYIMAQVIKRQVAQKFDDEQVTDYHNQPHTQLSRQPSNTTNQSLMMSCTTDGLQSHASGHNNYNHNHKGGYVPSLQPHYENHSAQLQASQNTTTPIEYAPTQLKFQQPDSTTPISTVHEQFQNFTKCTSV